MSTRTSRRANGLTILSGNHPRMRALRRAGHVAEIHGNKVWGSSFLIMRHLERYPIESGARVLEIGCGWGLLGQWCARRFDARVHGIDADANVLPYLALHAEVNGVEMSAERRRFSQLTTASLGEFDVVLGADVCFWDELTKELFQLIVRARRAGVGRVLVADPGRSPFDDLAERCRGRFEDVAVHPLTIARPVRASGEILELG